MYGCENRLLSTSQDLPLKIYKELLDELEGEAMIFVEAFEMFIDSKNNTEKR